MRMWRVKIFYIIVTLLVLGVLKESVFTTAEFSLDQNATSNLSSLPGKINLTLVTDYIWRYTIINGKLSQEKKEGYREGWMEKRDDIKFPETNFDQLPTLKGFFYYGPYCLSPDKSLMFASLSSQEQQWYENHFALFEMANNKIVFNAMNKNPIEDIAWSPDSRVFVVLEHSSRRWFGITGITGILSGDPMYVSTFYVSIYDRNATLLARSKVASGLVRGRGQISWTK